MNVYKITEPTILACSGGRSSQYMLWRTLDAHNGILPDFATVIFANTGREMPQTLDFVKKCSDEWNVNIIWLERYERLANQNAKNKYEHDLKIVTYETASRNGEPMENIIKVREMAPNLVARFCSAELKHRAITQYAVEYLGFDTPFLCYIGVRADEKRRYSKMHGTIESGQERYLPLYLDGITKKDIYNFWVNNDFDLDLPNNNGVTDWGNCDLCFLKGKNKKLSLIRERPDLADWWIKQEEYLKTKNIGNAAFFRSDQPSYKEMRNIVIKQNSLFDFDNDDSIPCYCGD